jgi:hypothetical protein
VRRRGTAHVVAGSCTDSKDGAAKTETGIVSKIDRSFDWRGQALADKIGSL